MENQILILADELKKELEKTINIWIKKNFNSIEHKKNTLNEFIECPFSEETMNIYLFIEKKFGTETPTMFGLYWKFLYENGLINKNIHRLTKQRYVKWINSRYKLNITRLQTNVSKSMLIGLKKSLNEYNKLKKLNNQLN